MATVDNRLPTEGTQIDIEARLAAIETALASLMADTTGQSIASAISGLVNAVKPDASDIPYDSNTTVKQAIDGKVSKSELETETTTTGTDGFQIMVSGNVVAIDGNGIYGGSFGTVPSGYRPNRIRYIPAVVASSTNYYLGYITVTSSGAISAYYINTNNNVVNVTTNTSYRVFVTGTWLLA